MCAFSPEEHALFEKTGEWVFKRLRKTRNPEDLLGVVATAHKGFDRAQASAPEAARAAVACRAGCDACCHTPVGAQAHEVLLAAQHVQTRFPAAALEELITRAAGHRAAFAGRPVALRAALRSPCVALRDGACTIYEARPESCRSHHSHDAGACRVNMENGNENLDVFIPALRARMFAVMLGIDQAVEESGFDDRAYDFGSALHEALTNSLCAVRWTRREAAFPDDCLEEAGEAGPRG
jgi:Fe-S-cluster containining protein